jgi:predicted carbohydrate-binding protein with CBM5 and CBM33 domain
VTAVRKIAAVGIAPLVLMALAGPADAHGAMTDPISRAAACGPEGGQAARSTACRAARAAGDAAALREWDNLKVPGVGGRDRRVIPDGKLCSGGLDAYRGLDLPRPDWPATRLTSGARFAFAYRTTIPHRGTFRLYVTRDGYNPARRLKWSDLEPRPFAAVADPPMRNGSYVMKGRLPRGKSGRHMIFTIWRNSSTPDTYYSCSDVVFGGRSGGAGGSAGGGGAGKAKSPTPTHRERRRGRRRRDERGPSRAPELTRPRAAGHRRRRHGGRARRRRRPPARPTRSPARHHRPECGRRPVAARQRQGAAGRGCVSYMRSATNNPEAAVSAATVQTAAGMPKASATAPETTAPTAKPPSRHNR